MITGLVIVGLSPVIAMLALRSGRGTAAENVEATQRVDRAGGSIEALDTFGFSSSVEASIGDTASLRIERSGQVDRRRPAGQTAFAVELSGGFRSADAAGDGPPTTVSGEYRVLESGASYLLLSAWPAGSEAPPAERPWRSLSTEELGGYTNHVGLDLQAVGLPGVVALLDRVVAGELAPDLDAQYPDTAAIRAEAAGSRALADGLMPQPLLRAVTAAIGRGLSADDAYLGDVSFTVWIDGGGLPRAVRFDATSYYREVFTKLAATPGASDRKALEALADQVSVSGEYELDGFDDDTVIGAPNPGEISGPAS